MKHNNKAVIIIPIYKENVTNSEKASLLQCFNVLNRYDIVFICGNSLDTTFYEQSAKAVNINYKIRRFTDVDFVSTQSYSRFMLKKDLYKTVQDYDYMLIYQLDAWVFEDMLEYWCNQGFDYIGAPWFKGYDKTEETSELLPYAGNGGFSLRKISSILEVLNSRYTVPFKDFYPTNEDNNFLPSSNEKIIKNFQKFSKIFKKIKKFLKQKATSFFETTNENEDIVFVKHGAKAIKNFKVAPPEIAMFFSFEAQPKRLFEMTNSKLPFGCHGFEKYNKDFWQDYIKI